MLILKCVMLTIIIVIPIIIGTYIKKDSIIHAYIYGHLILWALFQAVAVPIVHLRWSFDILFYVYLALVGILVIFSIRNIPAVWKSIHMPKLDLVLVFAIVIILIQVGMYVLGQHLDEDDARWIAEANDALIKNRMYLHNPATGEYIGAFRGEMVKDVFSPWAMYLAVMAKFTGIRPVAIAHTIYAPLLLALSYMVYARMGELLFHGDTERHIFLLSVSVINLFFSGNPYTQSVFSLVRIWQGKAVVAAVMIPLAFVIYLEITEKNLWQNWMSLVLYGLAGCLFSGMGIAISLLLIASLGGYAVICRRWGRIWLWMLACLPPIIYGYSYYVMKG